MRSSDTRWRIRLSPRIHALFARQVGKPIQYEAIDAPARRLRRRARGFAAHGGRGAQRHLAAQGRPRPRCARA
jgi:hypothetical protein